MSPGKLIFRADRLLEAVSGYERPIKWDRIRQWRETPKCLWDCVDTEIKPWNDPVIRSRVVNQAISLLDNLGHVDVNWSDSIAARRPTWYLTSWTPGSTEPEYVLSGARCKHMIEQIQTSMAAVVEEATTRVSFDYTLKKIEETKNVEMEIVLPDRVSLSGASLEECKGQIQSLEGISTSFSPSNAPQPWAALSSIGRSEDLEEVLLKRMREARIPEDQLKSTKWLDADTGLYKRKIPRRYQDGKLSLRRWNRPGRGYNYQLLKKVGQSLHMHETKMCEIGYEEAAWMSFRLSSLGITQSIIHTEDGHFRSNKALKLPRIIKRALVQCSGRPPRTVDMGGSHYEEYENVSSIIALKIAELLNFDIWDIGQVRGP